MSGADSPPPYEASGSTTTSSKIPLSTTSSNTAKQSTPNPSDNHLPSTLAEPQLSRASDLSQSPPPKGIHKLGRRVKDTLTHTTHSERERMRAQRARDEQESLEQSRRFHRAVAAAAETGVPQFIGKDAEGHDLYVEDDAARAMGYHNPYAQGLYADPNARFVRPQGRSNHGGGLGLPIGLGLGGALLVGSLLTGAIF